MVLRRFERKHCLTICKSKEGCLFTLEEFFNYNPFSSISKNLSFDHSVECVKYLFFCLAYHSTLSPSKPICFYNKRRFYFLYPSNCIIKVVKSRDKGCWNFVFLHKVFCKH